jgi:hypothetical protein
MSASCWRVEPPYDVDSDAEPPWTVEVMPQVRCGLALELAQQHQVTQDQGLEKAFFVCFANPHL